MAEEKIKGVSGFVMQDKAAVINNDTNSYIQAKKRLAKAAVDTQLVNRVEVLETKLDKILELLETKNVRTKNPKV